MSEPVVIITTRERVEAFIRHLSQEFLGHSKDAAQVRALIADAERALKEATTP